MENSTCSVCGLPNDLCVCSEVDKTASLIEIKIERRKYGKFWSVVTGIDVDIKELKSILKEIKNKMACGGTIKGKTIEILYGRHDRTNDLINNLEKLGFNKESIHISKG